MPVVSECVAGSAAQQWLRDEVKTGTLCLVSAPQEMCFNVQNCGSKVVLHSLLTGTTSCAGKGEAAWNNELFSIDAEGLMRSKLRLQTHIEPGSGSDTQLQIFDDDIATPKGSFTFNNGSLVYTKKGAQKEQLCVTQHMPPSPPPPSGSLQVWYKPLLRGQAAVALFNRFDDPSSTQPITVNFADLPVLQGSSICTVREVWTNKVHEGVQRSFTAPAVRSRQAVLVIISNCR